jgi:hypothetical protein
LELKAMTEPQTPSPRRKPRYLVFAGASIIAIGAGVLVAELVVGNRLGGLCGERLVLPPLTGILTIACAVGTVLLWRRRRVLAWSLGCGGLAMLAWSIVLISTILLSCATPATAPDQGGGPSAAQPADRYSVLWARREDPLPKPGA